MDSLSQVVLGAAVCHSIAGKQLGRKALALGAIMGTLPDLDVLIHYGDAVKNFTYHRGFSHSLLFLTLISPLLTWLVRLIPAMRQVSSKKLWIAIWLALITHPLLDSFTVYGTQLFWPLPAIPESWSSLFIVDPLYTLPLLIACGIVLFKPKRARITQVGLIISTLYIAWSLVAKHTIETKLISTLRQNNISYQNIMSVPTAFNTLLWRTVVMDKDHYYEAYVSVFDDPKAIPLTVHLNNKHWLPELGNNWAAQRVAWFTGGYYKLEEHDGQIIVQDLRMGMEGSYIFSFAVANIDAITTPIFPVPVPAYFPPDLYRWILQRIRSPIQPLPPIE